MFTRILKPIGFIAAAAILTNWMAGGQDDILEGPPSDRNVSIYYPPPNQP